MGLPTENEKTTCGAQHQQLMEWMKTIIENVSQHEAHISTSLENQVEIFERLKSIQSTLDRNSGLEKTVEKLTILAEQDAKSIEKLQLTLENGLNKRTLNIEESVKHLQTCIETFQHESEINKAIEEAGMEGFLRKSWTGFKDKIGPVLIGFIVITILWGFTKAVVYKEYPFPTIPSHTEQLKDAHK